MGKINKWPNQNLWELNVNLNIIQEIPMNANDTKKTISKCKELNTDFILVLHGGFTMGDVALTFAESNFKLGFWSQFLSPLLLETYS